MGSIAQARGLLEAMEGLLEKRLSIVTEVSEVSENLRQLSARLARGELSDESYRTAREEMEVRKSELQNSIAEIDIKLYRDKFEKPVF